MAIDTATLTFLASFLGSSLALLSVQRKPETHDPEREYRKLEMRLRRPWRARFRRWSEKYQMRGAE